MNVRFRRATGDDAEALQAIMVEGFDGYRSFAPGVPPGVVTGVTAAR